ncbi:MAG: hypothetical protein NTX71_01385 [Candidatus Aureabacteria bacterium]|nr:hypothetical protein [Candidatus Auribacterota bacterium]
MMHKWDDSRGNLVPVPFPNMLRRASLALCLSLALAHPVPADVVKLKNGELITCKVIKEMQGLIKVRMPHRGKIVTTFLNRGSIESINKSADVENRKHFQSRGVHNPGRAYEPVYYSGSAPAPQAARGPGGRPMPAKGKAKGEKTSKKRGVDARRGQSEARAKERSDRFGERSSKGSKGETSTTPSSPAAPTTSESSGTTVGSFGGGAGVSLGR